MFCSALGGSGGGGRKESGWMLGKPHGGSLYCVNPLRVIGAEERKILDAKRGILQGLDELKVFASAQNLVQLVTAFNLHATQLFPNAAFLLLAKRGQDYFVVSKEGISFDPAELNLSAANSIVRTAGEAPEIERRTIYLPDLNQANVFLASKLNRVVAGEVRRDYQEIEEGTIAESGLVFDLISLRRAGVEAAAVAPILEYKHSDPSGAVVLMGKAAFLNPMVDLLVLRDLADMLAKPLNRIIT